MVAGAIIENDLQGISRRPQNSPVKLSLPQQRHLFLELLDHDTAVNNISLFLRLKGKLDIGALEESANQMLARHEVLRTCFSFSMGIPAPEILNDLRIA